jgi:hypothetical protein
METEIKPTSQVEFNRLLAVQAAGRRGPLASAAIDNVAWLHEMMMLWRNYAIGLDHDLAETGGPRHKATEAARQHLIDAYEIIP